MWWWMMRRWSLFHFHSFGALVAGVFIEIVCRVPCAAGVVINEVYYDHPGRDDGWEFVEIHNPDAVPYALAGWVLEAVDGATGNAKSRVGGLGRCAHRAGRISLYRRNRTRPFSRILAQGDSRERAGRGAARLAFGNRRSRRIRLVRVERPLRNGPGARRLRGREPRAKTGRLRQRQERRGLRFRGPDTRPKEFLPARRRHSPRRGGRPSVPGNALLPEDENRELRPRSDERPCFDSDRGERVRFRRIVRKGGARSRSRGLVRRFDRAPLGGPAIAPFRGPGVSRRRPRRKPRERHGFRNARRVPRSGRHKRNHVSPRERDERVDRNRERFRCRLQSQGMGAQRRDRFEAARLVDGCRFFRRAGSRYWRRIRRRSRASFRPAKRR